MFVFTVAPDPLQRRRVSASMPSIIANTGEDANPSWVPYVTITEDERMSPSGAAQSSMMLRVKKTGLPAR